MPSWLFPEKILACVRRRYAGPCVDDSVLRRALCGATLALSFACLSEQGVRTAVHPRTEPSCLSFVFKKRVCFCLRVRGAPPKSSALL